MYKIISQNDLRSCIAIKNIPRDSIIFRERVNFIVDKEKDYWYEELMMYELENNCEKFLDLVPLKHDKFIINDGIFKKISKNKIDLDLFYNKIIRNAFNIKIDEKNYATVLYRGRQFNHSCDPNIKFRFVLDDGNMYMDFYACKDIKKGEELFDNYFDINLPYQKRQYISQKYYGFICQCKKCICKK